VENAFRHAHASRIEVDIRYDVRMLRLRVRDNGIGIDPTLLQHGGLDGHWGLPGMRERANSVGGRLGVWSEINRGTEIEVTIPGSVAYVRTGNRRRFRDSDAEEGAG
jgi:signal transduction histidine kinase